MVVSLVSSTSFHIVHETNVIWLRDNNPRYGKRIVELQHLPEEYFTPALTKLREEGRLPQFNTQGCKI